MKYRLLRKNEFVRNGDEFLEDGEWEKSVNWALQKPNQSSNFKYRRPIKSTSRTSTNSRMGSLKPSQICPHCKGSGKLPHAAPVGGNK